MAARGHRQSRRGRGIGVDLGTANTLIHAAGRGIVLREPSVVAVDSARGVVLAVGTEAKRMVGRTPDGVVAIRPLKDGVIADLEVAEAMLRVFLKRVRQRPSLFRPTVVITIPSDLTEVERRAVRDATMHAGARRVLLIEEPLAAAIGAGLPVTEPRGSMVLNIGGGTSEVAVIAMNGIVAGRSIRVGGDEVDEAIVAHVRREFNLEIGVSTAEQIKHEIGSAYPLNGDECATIVRGRDLLTGLPHEVEVSSAQIREAILEAIGDILEAARQTLENTPPELSADIIQRGIALTGGGALLRGMDRLMARETRMPVRLVEQPLDCVVLGAGRALEDGRRFAEAFVKC